MPSFGVLFEPACSSAGRRPGRCVDDLVLAVNEVPAIGGMDDGAVQESAVKLRTGRVTPPASAGAEVQLEPDHPSLRASQGPPPTSQRVQQFQPATAGRLQVVRSALRGGERTGVLDLDPQLIVAQLIADPEPSPGSARGGMAERVGSHLADQEPRHVPDR